MDTKIILYFILIIYYSEALPFRKEHVDTLSTSDYEEEYEDLPLEEDKNENANSKTPTHTYEVTENVIDIPDDRYRGPIHANFTVHRPLNIAPVVIVDENSDEIGREGGKKNCISFLDVKDSNNAEDSVKSEDFDFDKIPERHGIKDYFDGLKKGIVSGFKSIIHRNKHEDFDEPKDSGPLSFLNKVHQKSTDIAHKFGNNLFGGKFDDVFGS